MVHREQSARCPGFCHENSKMNLFLIVVLQYTFILPASKSLPSQMVDWVKGKTKQRKSVGVRMPDNVICQVCGPMRQSQHL
jgi:tRNA A37 threonylcarbamoyladenosine synthetase subunit TsaC/SUA5/YrdC